MRFKLNKNLFTINLDLTAQEILPILTDLVFNENEYEDEVYDPYILSKTLIIQLLSCIGYDCEKVDTDRYVYELNSYIA